MAGISSYFLQPDFIVWFWLLVPLIIIYLIKPKPLNQTIPSLMFLLQDKGRAFRNSFLRYLYRDFVFFLQLLILALLIAAAAQPFISVAKTSLVGTSVIVLDASASMQAKDGRWDDALEAAKDSLSGQNTIILVGNRPVIIAKDASKSDAEDALDSLRPFDTETNLYAAIVATRDAQLGPDTFVTIISDFRNTDEQQDYAAAIRTVQATGAPVKLVPVGSADVKNVGIVSMDVQEDKTRIGITNFNNQATSVTLHAASLEQTVPLGPGSTDYVTISTPPGITEVSIDEKDDFPLDDHAIIANNPDLSVRVLVITNDPDIRQTSLWYALQAINDKTPLELTLDVNNPPTLASPEDYDLVVFSGVNPQLLVQRSVRDTASEVQKGKSAIIAFQDDLFGINFEGMLPYAYEGAGGYTAILAGEFSPLIKDVEFGDVQRYHKINGTGRTLAQAADGSPLVSLIPYGTGTVLYYGIDDKASSFPLEPYYPVFWKRALDRLGGRLAVDELNLKTGTPAISAATPKKVPSKFDFQGFYDAQGVYTYADREIAANLLSKEESRIAAEPLADALANVTIESTNSQKRKDLTSMAILAALALLFLELFIVKFRGDF